MRDINQLETSVALLCHQFVADCKKDGIDVLITCTFRTLAEQAELYARGRTKPGKKVTNAKPGFSFHNFRLAFDFVPIVHGKAVWNDPALFTRCGEIGESIGLEWAGRWKTFKEMAHMQYTDGHPLSYFQNGGKLS